MWNQTIDRLFVPPRLPLSAAPTGSSLPFDALLALCILTLTSAHADLTSNPGWSVIPEPTNLTRRPGSGTSVLNPTNSSPSIVPASPLEHPGIVNSGIMTDLAILGDGWFVLRDVVSDELFVTDWGAFRTDQDGYMVSHDGLRLQGVAPNTGEQLDLALDRWAPTHADARLVAYHFDSQGLLTLVLSDGNQFVAGRVLLAAPPPAESLTPAGWHRYRVVGPITTGTPGSSGLGTLHVGGLGYQPPPAQKVRLTAFDGNALAEPFGPITGTGVQTDFALEGRGFFLLRNPTNNEYRLTRAGAFLKTADGWLTTYDGLRVQSWNETSADPVDLSLTPVVESGQHVAWWGVNRQGTVRFRTTTGLDISGGTLAVVKVPDPARLQPLGGATYRYPTELTAPTLASAAERPDVLMGCLETSRITSELAAKRVRLKFFTQGPVQLTNIKTDLAIEGDGFFLLRNPGDGSSFVTRAGAFEVSSEGFLVSSRERFFPVSPFAPSNELPPVTWQPTLPGLRLQGYCDTAREQIGDLRIDPLLLAAGGSFHFAGTGEIVGSLPGQPTVFCGQVLLQLFEAAHDLVHAQLPDGTSTRIVYTQLEQARPQAAPSPPGTVGLGKVLAGALETILLDNRPVHIADADPRWFCILGDSYTVHAIEATVDFKRWVRVGACQTDAFGRSMFRVGDAPELRNVPSPTALPLFMEWGQSCPTQGWIPDPGPAGFFRISRQP